MIRAIARPRGKSVSSLKLRLPTAYIGRGIWRARASYSHFISRRADGFLQRLDITLLTLRFGAAEARIFIYVVEFIYLASVSAEVDVVLHRQIPS